MYIKFTKIFILIIWIILASWAQSVSAKNDFLSPDKLKEIGVPALISLAALGKFGSVNENFSIENKSCVVDDKKIIDKTKPKESEKKFSEVIKKLIADGVIKKAAQDSGLDEKQIKEAFTLVKSGKFKKDVVGSMEQFYQLNQKLPLKLLKEINNPQLSQDLIKGLLLGGVPTHLFPQCSPHLTNLLDSNITGQELGQCAPKSIHNVLSVIYKNPTTSDLIKTIRIFTHKENRSARLAIIAYAKLHGIDITEDDLDKLDKFLDSSQEPELSPLISAGIEKLYEKYKVNDAKSVIEKIRTRDQACSIS